MSDRILISDLTLRCIIGTNPEERNTKQSVVINIALECDLSRAASTDRIEDTINYRSLKRRIVDDLQSSSYFLVERMAGRIIQLCMDEPRVDAVTVRVEKPGALTGAGTVGVEMRRVRKGR